MDSHSMNRKDFLKLTFTLIGGATVVAGCSSSSNGGSGGASGSGGSTGSGGSNADAKVDTGPAILCADPLATSQIYPDGTGHMHMLFVPLSALSMTTDQFELTTGFPMDSSGHFHTVMLSVADLATLKGGGSVTKTSSMAGDPAHSHMYVVSCHGD